MALYKVKGSKSQSGGHWVTIKDGRWKGQHVFIKDGQTFDQALEERKKHSSGLEDRPVANKLAKQKASKEYKSKDLEKRSNLIRQINKLDADGKYKNLIDDASDEELENLRDNLKEIAKRDKLGQNEYLMQKQREIGIINDEKPNELQDKANNVISKMYKTKEEQMRDNGIQLSDRQIAEGNRLTNKAENGVRDDIKAFLSGKENYDGSQEQFINDLSDNWGVDKERVENILHEESSKHPRLFKGDIPEKDNKIIPGTMFHEKNYDEVIDLTKQNTLPDTKNMSLKDERQVLTRELAREIYGKGISDEVADRYGKELQQPGEGTVTTDLEDWEFDKDKLEWTNAGLRNKLIYLRQGYDASQADAKKNKEDWEKWNKGIEKATSSDSYNQKISEYYDEREKNALLNKDMTYGYSDKALKNMSNKELDEYINKQNELVNQYSSEYEKSKTYDQRYTRNRQDTVWNSGMKTKYEAQLKRANNEKIRREEDLQKNFRILTPEESKEQDIKIASGQTLNRKEISKQEKEERLIDNMIVGSYGNQVSYRDKENNLWTTSRNSYNKYVNGESQKIGGTYAGNDEHALKDMITSEAYDKYEYKGYLDDEKTGKGKERDTFIKSEFERLKGQAYDSTNTRKERVKTNENYAKYYNSEGVRHDIAEAQAKQKEDMLKNGFKQKVDMNGGEYYYEPERIKRMEEAGTKPMTNSYTGGGWQGTKYDSKLSTKDIGKNVVSELKKKYPDVKIARKGDNYSMGSSIDFNIMSSGKNLYVTDKDIDKMEDFGDITTSYGFENWAKQNIKDYKEKHTYTTDDVRNYAKGVLAKATKYDQNVRGDEWYLSDYGKKVVSDLNKEANSYTYSDNDGMVDYFDHGTYMHISIGKWDKPYEISPSKTTTKAMNLSQLVQSYVDRGYSEETARKMAQKAVNKRKRK